MRDRYGSLVLPRYNTAAASGGAGTMSPSSTSPSTTPSTSPSGSQRAVPLERGDSILLDIEGGEEMGDAATLSKRQGTWWQPSMIASPFRTAVVSNLGSAVSTGWSRARSAVVGSSLTSYIRRVPALEKPFDLSRDMPGGPNNI
ncbi:unnamed protein product [Calypogeia fissa]